MKLNTLKVLRLIAFAVLFLAILTPVAFTQKIQVTGTKLIINGSTINKWWRLPALVKVLGKADRVDEGYNHIHTYDDLGIMVFTDQDDNIIREVQFAIDPDGDTDFYPDNTFKGSFKMEKMKFKNTLSMKKLNKKLSKFDFEDSLLPDTKVGRYKGVYLYIGLDDDGTTVIDYSLGLEGSDDAE